MHQITQGVYLLFLLFWLKNKRRTPKRGVQGPSGPADASSLSPNLRRSAGSILPIKNPAGAWNLPQARPWGSGHRSAIWV